MQFCFHFQGFYPKYSWIWHCCRDGSHFMLPKNFWSLGSVTAANSPDVYSGLSGHLVSSESSYTKYNLLLTDGIAMLEDYTSCLMPVIIIRGRIPSPSQSNLPFYGLVSRISDSFWQLGVWCLYVCPEKSMNANASVSCCKSPTNALSGIFLAFWQD